MLLTMATEEQSLRYITLDVFTSSRYAGNPLALVLVPPGQDVPTELMQRVAREFNYSETVFLYENNDQAEWRMRIFTVDAELPFAGHPTIGTASYVLSLQSNDTKLRCNAGLIDIGYVAGAQSIWAEIPHDFHRHEVVAVQTQQVLDVQPGLRADSIKTIDIVSPVKGMTFMVAELTDLEALASVAISGKRPSLQLDDGWDQGFVAIAFYVKIAEDTYHTRMIEKIFEDPATGSMSCGLATLLAMRSKSQTAELKFIQGVDMGRRSEIGVSVVLCDDLQTLKQLKLKGTAVKVMEGKVFL